MHMCVLWLDFAIFQETLKIRKLILVTRSGIVEDFWKTAVELAWKLE